MLVVASNLKPHTATNYVIKVENHFSHTNLAYQLPKKLAPE